MVEDNKINQMVMSRLLSRHGHECMAANNGAEALSLLYRHSFDAVFMDVHMPVMDGLDATREIRRREAESGRHVPIIALTASAITTVAQECIACGMDYFLSKPMQLRAVRDILTTIPRAK